MVFLKLGKKKKKESNSIVLSYIADVTVSTNPSYIYAKIVFNKFGINF